MVNFAFNNVKLIGINIENLNTKLSVNDPKSYSFNNCSKQRVATNLTNKLTESFTDLNIGCNFQIMLNF